MVHLDRLVDTHAASLIGRSRPNLAGRDLYGRWVLIEAKGRTGPFSQAAMQQAKAQVCEAKYIDGVAPHLRVGMQMYFAPTLRTELVDPEEPRRDAVSLTIGTDSLRSMYYKRLFALRSRSQRQISLRDRNFAFIDYESVGVSVGIADLVEEHMSMNTLEPIIGMPDEYGDSLDEVADGKRSCVNFAYVSPAKPHFTLQITQRTPR